MTSDGDRPFLPASAIYPPDMQARQQTALRAVRRRRARHIATLAVAGLTVVGTMAALTAGTTSNRVSLTPAAIPTSLVTSSASPEPSATPTATAKPTTTAAPVPTPAAALIPAPLAMRHGTVRDVQGQPISGVWVATTQDLAAAQQTGPSGKFSLPCTPSPLVATDWRIVTNFVAPGEAFSQQAGLGHAYTWTGGGADLQSAAPLPMPCDSAIDLVMRPGAAIDVQLLQSDGSRYQPVLPDDLFQIDLAGFGKVLPSTDAARWDDNAHFHLSGLRAEEVGLDPVFGNWNCTGLSGPVRDGWFLPVNVVERHTSSVTCRHKPAPSPAASDSPSATPKPSQVL